jgi:hypothetical protein
MKKVIIGCRAPKKISDALSELGFEIISLPAFSVLPAPVSAHADMLIFLAEGKLFCHKDYYKIARDSIDEILMSGYELVLSNEYISEKYPNDILFNAVSLNGKIYAKKDYISRFIAENNTVINVNQGYTKCSVCKVCESAIITSDPSIKDVAEKNDIDVLFISEGNITLPGYDTGFIGGCSGYDGDKIYFSGNIFLHPNGAEISEFCKSHGKNVVILSDEPLFDVGSIFFV